MVLPVSSARRFRSWGWAWVLGLSFHTRLTHDGRTLERVAFEVVVVLSMCNGVGREEFVGLLR